MAKCLAGEHNLSKRAVGSIYVYDFGKVKEGKILKHDFLFKNASGKILNIKNTYTSCGCTVSKVKHKKVLPEKSTIISVSVDTRGYSGPIEQYAYVQTDDPAVLIITFVVKAWVER